ncbi:MULTISPECIES: hypothetical protein [Arthrospira]|jgi:hypothetical protein|uniref:Uncharacterized protein n=1 Tax=Limnospira platensis NIES-46 TaxID=1236695 RepID=A0A5M3TDH2_LIMPL|nr:hypothetical protein [Arthrospira platensis]AMW27813.1 hypothetical protein AP285_07285 [Arthrospira platensis YZ]KDR58915.1 hypothetical protein APPUASWS_002190 [Arthrospira platensis str. Paraca]MBD2668752.1 hypothetical protein [Arthrospira platensis FACHB-439]MBD2712792.1 hypothetical protein [Arthrospira platensis FACHB-835]MDF2210716.1 hypothetical protein [Arthrospira platensis NCB002]MDT9182195.1 hypothetical protein [Limnospira sp. PMC 289.06]MDT9294341.1 hypothetical protein [Ar
MNIRLVIFSGIIMAGIGSVFGLAVSHIAAKPYQCCGVVSVHNDVGYSQSRHPQTYAVAGSMMGFVAGSVLEALRQAELEHKQN